MNLWDVISRIFPDGQTKSLFTLFEDGVDFSNFLLTNPLTNDTHKIAFVLGDEIGFTKEEESKLRAQTMLIRIGPIPLLASQAIIVTHNFLDVHLNGRIHREK